MTSPRLAYEQVARSIGKMGNCRNNRCCGAKALDSDDSGRLNGGAWIGRTFFRRFCHDDDGVIRQNPSGVHFPVYKRSFGAANFVPAYTCSLGVQGSSRSIWSAGDFTDDTYQAKEPVEDLGRWRSRPTAFASVAEDRTAGCHPMGAAQHSSLSLDHTRRHCRAGDQSCRRPGSAQAG